VVFFFFFLNLPEYTADEVYPKFVSPLPFDAAPSGLLPGFVIRLEWTS